MIIFNYKKGLPTGERLKKKKYNSKIFTNFNNKSYKSQSRKLRILRLKEGYAQ